MPFSLSVENWKPPDITSLDFSSNCTIVRRFLKSWFDLTPYEDINDKPGHSLNVSFWVPETIDARATELYFQQALPPEMRNVTSYGAILEWEGFLRSNYSQAVAEFLELVEEQNGTDIDPLPLDIPYYDHIIYNSSCACTQEVCSLGFDWDNLSDINGPGVFIYYAILLVIGCIYSVIALIDACRHNFRPVVSRPQQLQKPRRQRGSLISDLFATMLLIFDGFSDGAAVFSFALPCAARSHITTGDPTVPCPP